jgi:hypothetical protein
MTGQDITRRLRSSTVDKAFGSVPTDRGQGGPPRWSLEPWPLTIPGCSPPGAGSTGQRLFGQEANNDRVA